MMNLNKLSSESTHRSLREQRAIHRKIAPACVWPFDICRKAADVLRVAFLVRGALTGMHCREGEMVREGVEVQMALLTFLRFT